MVITPEFYDRMTPYGPVRSLRMKNGNHLVMKTKMGSMTLGKGGAPIKLPESFRNRSIGNLHAIKGVVVLSSAPYRSKHPIKRWRWDPEAQEEKIVWEVKAGQVVPSQLKSGDLILYNSYNLGYIEVEGEDDPLVVVREIDILMTYPEGEEVELCR